ncbi:hypothetical protein ACN8ZM_36910 [Burkholderia aenigmatica]|uniref:hypothetical protein n=1 Tax=Burkholderia aenigmatica TaxID=2015348 RepID=UPI003B42AC13
MPVDIERGAMQGQCRTRLHALHTKGLAAFGLVLTASCVPTWAEAHAWNVPYYLPVPLWLYAYAAAGTLIISFMILAFAGARIPIGESRPDVQQNAESKALRIPATALKAGQIASVLFLALLIVAGLAGTPNPFQNISMSGFWIWFYLGAIYVSAVLGDVYAFANPVACLLRIAARHFPAIETGRYRYPRSLAAYPALVPYVALVALELFGAGRPRDVSVFLLSYIAYALAGAFCFGRGVWLTHFDMLGILYRLCAKLSPFGWRSISNGDAAIQLRNPIADIASEPPLHMSIVAFLSFMLSSTAYDGLRDTAPWNRFFWGSIYPHIVRYIPALGKNYALSGEVLLVWQWLTFAAIGVAYYVLFRLFCTLQATSARTSLNGKAIAQQFCLALLPIALFYNVCHYFTLFLGQARQVLVLVSDPLGLGWHLLPALPALSDTTPAQSLINMGYIWHAQVLLILVGHLLSVYVTHAIVVRNHVESSVVSELPLLVLTIALTVSGLWILSLPLA